MPLLRGQHINLTVAPPNCPGALSQVRINGENPAKDFQPCPGILGEVAFPFGEQGAKFWGPGVYFD
jgi:biotin carboxylase